MSDDAELIRPGQPGYAKSVVDRLGGASTLARDLQIPGERPDVRVNQWAVRGSIPSGFHSSVARLARKRGCKDITVEALAADAEARRLAETESV